MSPKIFIVLFSVLGISSAYIVSPGSCQQKTGIPGSGYAFGFNSWYKYVDTETPTQKLCNFGTFITYPNATTIITDHYKDAQTGQSITNYGTAQVNDATGVFTVDLEGFPRQATYYLLDFTPMAGTFYFCLNLPDGSKGEGAFVVVSSLYWGPFVLERSKQIIAATATHFNPDYLQLCDNTNCYAYYNQVAPSGPFNLLSIL